MVLNKLKLYGELVMFRHTLFALPFALMSMLFAADGWPSLMVLFWILVALVGARNAANAVNRLIDYKIDKKNPRTADRHLPKGEISRFEVLGLTIFGFILLFVASWQLNPLCFYLSPLAVFILIFYSYTKRFTWGCHFVLGLAVGLAPLGSWLAIRGSFALAPVLLTVAVALWVAGFDIIYATQDVDFDRREGIQAVPARFGVEKALNISLFCHGISVFILAIMPFFFSLGIFYMIGVLIVAFLLAYEHKIISPNNLERVKIASYNINEVVGVAIFLFTVIDLLI